MLSEVSHTPEMLVLVLLGIQTVVITSLGKDDARGGAFILKITLFILQIWMER